MKAYGSFVLARKQKGSNRTEGGILLPTEVEENRAMILSVGSEVETLERGDVVYYSHSVFSRDDLVVVHKDSILMTEGE